jgi:hypothetical protein
MTAKFDKFKEALIALCKEHDVCISGFYGYAIGVFDGTPDDSDVVGDIGDCTIARTEQS